MLPKPDIRVLEAMQALEDRREFRELVDWLARVLERQRHANDTQREIVALRHGQGAAQVLADLLATVTEAGETLARVRAAARRQDA